MGADFIDYIVADKVVIPEELKDDYVEKIIYLPNCYQVNDSKRKIQKTKFSRVDFSLPENSFIFCCFNNTYKITPQIFEVWMRILRNVENSVLWLFEDNKLASKNLVFEAKKSGVDQNRIIFAKRLPNNLHIERQQLADLFLDTSPYNAHTTCSDALWSDLPVLTCPGKSFASRVAASLLRSLNLDELIVDSFDEYAAKAIFLANNPLYLEQIKNKLKINKLDSSLFNSKVFAQNIEKSYEAIYERHIKNLPPCDIHII
jgi:predicted O-linked N-acetylglucosamine transferase (SPINDLY family)